MKAVLKISFGSILRNKRIMAVMLISIIFAVAVFVLISSVVDWIINAEALYEFEDLKRDRPNRSDEELWELTVENLTDIERLEYVFLCIFKLFIVIAALLVIFAVGSAFKTTEGERTKILSVLSTLGATTWQKAVYLLLDVAIISIIGVPLGILFGYLLSSAMLDFMNENFFYEIGIYGVEVFGKNTPFWVFSLERCFLVGFAAVIIAAAIPALKMIRRPAVEAARATNAINVSLRESRLDRLMERLFGVTGKLAAANYQNNKPRYRSFSMTISLSSLIFVLISLLFGYLSQLNGEEISNNVKIFLYMLFALVFLLCIFGASGSFYTNFKRRYSEFAALESLGMEKRSLSAMVAVEAIYYGIYTFVFIAVGTFAIDYAAYYFLWAWQPTEITFIMPTTEIGAAFGGVLLITLALSLFMSLSVRKIKTVELLKNNW
ncbi:MAG: FtsX-like permease family protein [Clostridiales bacterium]|nr:FtsX-like permease family protein [Clostridiales bacterium]